MPLIFDGFPTSGAAERFARRVARQFGRRTKVFSDPESAADVALFPFEVTGFVVLVGRRRDWRQEPDIESLAPAYGGRFAGT